MNSAAIRELQLRATARLSAQRTRRRVLFGVIISVVIGLVILSGALIAQAGSSNDAPTTPATTIHGLPANNPGHGGSSANPQGQGVNGGNGIHNIAGVQANGTGQLADEPPSCTAHGGLDSYNKNC